jgi:hypothetical protein
MANPVWSLSVDLTTKTATFQSGLADAAKNARGAFADIKSGAGEMGSAVGYSTGEARHSVMMLGEEFGVHLPRALTTFIASIGPIGPALEAAFPFLAIAVGATLLIEHLAKMHEAGEKLTDDQVRFGTAIQNAFNTLDEKILQARIRSDELRNDHLGALRLQLELIDKQSMKELVHSFEEVAKAADVVMKDLQGHWYTFGIGSDGANHALQQFRTQWESLVAQGKSKEASDLLAGTRQSAEHILDMMKQYKANQTVVGGDNPHGGDYNKFEEAALELKKAGVGVTEKEIQAQQNLVGALRDVTGLAERANELKSLDKANAGKSESNQGATQAAAAARQAAESQMRLNEQTLASERATAEALLTTHRASIEGRLASDIAFAGRDRDIQLAANQAEVSGLDKSGKDYQNQLKGLQEKSLEITGEYATKVAELKAKATTAEYNRDLTALEQSEREKIETTQQGSAARLSAIDAAIKQEQAANLQDTNFFRDLLNQRAKFLQQETEEENKRRTEAGTEAAGAEEKSALLTLSAEKQHQALLDSSWRMSQEQRMSEEQKFATDEYNIKLKALEQDKAALDKSGKDYNNNLKRLQDQEKQLTQQHANEIEAIKEKAEEASNQRILAAEQRSLGQISSGLAQSIMGHETWSRMLISFGDQAAEGMIKNSLMILMQQDKERMGDARKAATSAYATGEKIGGPAGPILGPIFAAAAFAGVMAFESGGVVPGVGRGDIVPSMLEPGEGVVPGGVMDGLSKLARSGGLNGGGHTYHVHVRPTYNVNTIDGDGMQATLEKHSDQLQRHFEGALRKMNR